MRAVLLLLMLPIAAMGLRRASVCFMSYPAGCTDAETGEQFKSYGTDENGFEITEPPAEWAKFEKDWNSQVSVPGYDFRNSGVDRENQGPASRKDEEGAIPYSEWCSGDYEFSDQDDDDTSNEIHNAYEDDRSPSHVVGGVERIG